MSNDDLTKKIKLRGIATEFVHSRDENDKEDHHYTPASTKLKEGYTGFTLSACPYVDRIVSALYV